jgi:hypothetical protein
LPVFGFSGHETRPVTEECTAAFRPGIDKTSASGGICRPLRTGYLNCPG